MIRDHHIMNNLLKRSSIRKVENHCPTTVPYLQSSPSFLVPLVLLVSLVFSCYRYIRSLCICVKIQAPHDWPIPPWDLSFSLVQRIPPDTFCRASLVVINYFSMFLSFRNNPMLTSSLSCLCFFGIHSEIYLNPLCLLNILIIFSGILWDFI